MSSEKALSVIAEGVVNALRLSVPRPFASKKIEPQHQLREDLGIDSLGLITLASLLEDEFGLSLASHTAALMRVVTVRELSDFIGQLIGRGSEEAARVASGSR